MRLYNLLEGQRISNDDPDSYLLQAQALNVGVSEGRIRRKD